MPRIATPFPAKKTFAGALWLSPFQTVKAVHPLRSRGQHAGINVTGRQLERCIGPQRLERSHDNGIRLLACGRGIAPNLPVGRRLAPQVRSKNLKVVLLAEERRQVGGEGIDKLLPLRPVVVSSQPR